MIVYSVKNGCAQTPREGSCLISLLTNLASNSQKIMDDSCQLQLMALYQFLVRKENLVFFFFSF